jgi:hypothetical protein
MDGSGLQWSAAELDFVSFAIAVDGFAHTVPVCFPLRRVDSSAGDLLDQRIEVFDEDGVHGMTGVFWAMLNEQGSMLGKFPHGLGVAGNEGGRGTQQPFVPFQRRRIVGDGDTRVQVEIRAWNHAYCSLQAQVTIAGL